jgi:hypothetical protein
MPDDSGVSGEAGARRGRDFWDKAQAIAGLSTAVLVAVIGGLFTYVYNERQLSAQKAQNQRTLIVDQVRVVETLFPHLSSSDKREKEFALIAISALGNPTLAVKLADTYRDEGSVGALERIAKSGDRGAAQAARRSLDDILAALRRAVVAVEVGTSRTSGFVIANGTVATVGSGVREGDRAELTYAGGDTEPARVVRGSGRYDTEPVLIESRPTDRPVLRIAPRSEVLPGIPVVVVGYNSGGWVGSTGSLGAEKIGDLGRQAFFEANIEPQRGVEGAPVVNLDGKVVGVVLPSHRGVGPPVLLLPASSVLQAARSRRAG